MPALHVVGEIVGASGLRPSKAFSPAHWLDLLSLHPSSRLGFFCRWRVRFDAVAAEKSTPWNQWQVLQGATSGQTQVHTWSPITPTLETITTTSGKPVRSGADDDCNNNSEELLELDTLWSHPVDLHLAIADPSSGISSWPYLELHVWSLDEFHHDHLVGSSSVPLPLATHEFFLDAPIIHVDPATNKCDDDGVSSSVGTLFMRLSVINDGFLERGIVS